MSLTVDIRVSPRRPFSVSFLLRVSGSPGRPVPVSVPRARIHFFGYYPILRKELVGMRGLEPPRCHHHRLLRPARLPVPPHPRANGIYEPDRGVSRQPSKQFGQQKIAGTTDTGTGRHGDTGSKIQLARCVPVSPVRRVPVSVFTSSVSQTTVSPSPAVARDTIIEVLANFNF